MNTLISKKDVEKSIKGTVWDLGNKVLYTLCSDNFTHDKAEKILAKIWLIGRSYAVALERRKNKKDINDSFYIDHVAPAFKKSMLDEKLKVLKSRNQNLESFNESLLLHGYLTGLLYKLTEMEKRSFSSKYLHFHLPDRFYIYDSRAVDALRRFVTKVPKDLEYLLANDSMDKEYAKFACKCFMLQAAIYKQHGLYLNPRQLDNLLIEVANIRLSAKNSSKLNDVISATT